MRPVLLTERLRLEPIAEAHTAGMVALHGDPEILRHIGDGQPYPPDATARMVLGMARRWTMDGFGWFAVLDRQTSEFLGAACVQPMDLNPRKPLELAWRIAREHWGRGYATEAAREIARWTFEDLGRNAAYAVARPDNTASLRVMEKLGMSYLGVEHHWGEDLPTYALRKEAFLSPQ